MDPEPLDCTQLDGLTTQETIEGSSAILFGTNVSMLLLSILTAQAYSYSRDAKRTGNLFKFFVFGLVALQFIESAADLIDSYGEVARGWGDPFALDNLEVAITDDLLPLTESLTAFAVQCFYIWRIFAFSLIYWNGSSKIIASLICLIILLVSLSSIASGLMIAIWNYSSSSSAAFPVWYAGIIDAWTATSATTDLAITLCMTAILLHARAQACYGATRDRISKVIRVSIQSGLATATLAVISLILNRQRNNLFPIALYILDKLYVVSLFANLNSPRTSFNAGSDEVEPLPQLRTITFRPRHRRNSDGTLALSIPALFHPGGTNSIVENEGSFDEESPPGAGMDQETHESDDGIEEDRRSVM